MDLYDVRRDLSMGKSVYDLPLRVTFYARVSTGTDEQAHSLQNQIKYYTDFINQNPKWTYIEGYVDEGLSGTSAKKRDSFLRMIDDAKGDKFDFIITKEISRFSRNTLDSIQYTQELLRYGVGVIFQSDNINTLMPDSELRLTIMSSIAQDEVRKISERVKFGFKRAVEKGVVLGNSKIWGYDKENGKLVIDPQEAEIVRTIFNLYAVENMGMRGIAKELTERGVRNTLGNAFSLTTIRNIIANPKYKGYYCGNKTQKYDYRSNDRKVFGEEDWIVYQDAEHIPPIVSEELWEKANVLLRKRSEKQKGQGTSRYDNKYKYSCKIICGEHQTYYYRSLYRYKSGNKEVWQCQKYVQNGKGEGGCSAPIVYTSEIDAVMLQCYQGLHINKMQIVHDLVQMYVSISRNSQSKGNGTKIKRKIIELQNRKDKLLDLSVKGVLDDDEFAIRNKAFNDEIKVCHKQLELLAQEEMKNEAVCKTVGTLHQLIVREIEFKDGLDQAIIDALINRIEVYKTDQDRVFCLKVYFKVLEAHAEYQIDRKNNTSVCTNPYI